MYKIGVIGDRESVLGFQAVGLDVFPAGDAEEAKKTLKRRVHRLQASGCDSDSGKGRKSGHRNDIREEVGGKSRRSRYIIWRKLKWQKAKY